jgi:hypothetical protein
MERRVRHRQPKGTVADGPLLYTTAPTLDPTAAHDVHVIMDNYNIHKTDLIPNWFANRPRFHVTSHRRRRRGRLFCSKACR